MEISANQQPVPVDIEAMKKARDVQEKQMQQILDASEQLSKQVTAQNTGVGVNLNINA